MLIQDYCYDGGQMGESGICGNPDPALVSQWKHWKEYLLPGKPALLDMPSSGNKRVILFSLAGSQLGVIGFSVSHTAVTDAGSLYFLYKAILSLNPETVTSAIAGNGAFDLLINPEQLEPPPVPAIFADVNGLQMIGSVDKALAVVTRLLPKEDYSQWAQTYFIAVNPVKYANEFSTVVSEETPAGEWQKLKSEHTEYPTSFAFACRRRAWIKRRIAPQQVFFAAIALLSILAWGLTLFFSVRECRRLRAENDHLEKQLDRNTFRTEYLRESMEFRQEEIRRLRDEKRKLEEKILEIKAVKASNR